MHIEVRVHNDVKGPRALGIKVAGFMVVRDCSSLQRLGYLTYATVHDLGKRT
jgi:hypothetical protein